MKELIGRQIQGMFVSEDQHLLVFHTDQGVLAYCAEGDCCSESWFADITNVKRALRPDVVVTDVEDILVPEPILKMYAEDGRTRQEYDQVYGYRIVLNQYSYMDIVYRNSSNGYYGGWCSLFEGSLDCELTAIITDEWSA